MWIENYLFDLRADGTYCLYFYEEDNLRETLGMT